ncbi:MAG: DUF2497 domain-containing protein, partial [Caulobacteraceae bacterium]
YVPPPAPAYTAPREDSDLISSAAATATASAFGRLEAALSMPAPGRSLDDVVRELLKPLLKQWLDDNLPRIAETAVTEAVEKLQRGRV